MHKLDPIERPKSKQALKFFQKLPCSMEQKLELADAAVKHLKEQT